MVDGCVWVDASGLGSCNRNNLLFRGGRYSNKKKSRGDGHLRLYDEVTLNLARSSYRGYPLENLECVVVNLPAFHFVLSSFSFQISPFPSLQSSPRPHPSYHLSRPFYGSVRT